MKTIGISGSLISKKQKTLLDALGHLFSIEFERRESNDDEDLIAWIRNTNHSTYESFNSRIPCYEVIGDRFLKGPILKGDSITFLNHFKRLGILRGRTIHNPQAAEFKALPEWVHNSDWLAKKSGLPIWVKRDLNNVQHHYTSIPIPELSPNEYLFQHFNGNRFLGLLPLWLFIRSSLDDHEWTEPPIRASFMFDDPNLHWKTYGFINYIALAHQAKESNFHVSFATIPLDSWYANHQASSIIKENKKYLSFLIHGNDHISKELSRSNVEQSVLNNLNRALYRINKFENRSNLDVSRIMAPPHGACNETAMRCMAKLGFEALCISRGSLYSYNRKASWLKTIGMKPSNIVCDLPVLPRFRLSKDCQNNIIIATLLNQPIIPVGHHHDISKGLGLLIELSDFINSLGDVKWLDLKSISRSHFAEKRSDGTLYLRMYSKRIEIDIPDGIYQIVIDDSTSALNKNDLIFWRTINDVNQSRWEIVDAKTQFRVPSGKRIEISSCIINDNVEKTSYKMKHLAWPIIRRILTETRDRLLPYHPNLFRKY